MPSDPQVTLPGWQNAASGAVAGLISRFVIAPLDVVKIRLQTQKITLGHALRLTSEADSKRYRSIVQAFRLIIKEEGLKSHALPHEIPNSAQTFLAGASAGCIATITTYPFDLLRTRFALQGRDRVYTGIFQAVSHIARREGLPGFYRGAAPAVVQIMPQMGIMFEAHAACKHALGRLKPHLPERLRGLDGLEEFISGGIAGVTAKCAVMPFDVVRKRLQVQGPDRNSYALGSIPRYNPSFTRCVAQIVRHEGVLALYKGVVPGVLKAAPSSAVTFFVYGECRKYFERRQGS
ncbi:mitochondrial carrier domain-containing protein [Blyttiomyces helicus]|uniref:Mitochondrial carrier domain-containing protein n=1 Tax=Blyttiomyces helicus TaxID=388810 RepID=A0A4P9WJG6_9FUNG|nr:mitochondrial carrier domain-containing protein [Blyttiomyces helicus]|eukprot:RKO92195.1 mitochondrial carrier domain-containing protein [Blyttiomyces helicus]